ncbi:MAG: hypothetical protein FWB99_09260 [Treponema sp.]|nr:hypothetical protein [Treponema sp.]
MNGGQITGNTAYGDSDTRPNAQRGGGVFMNGANSRIHMNGGSITGNTPADIRIEGGQITGMTGTSVIRRP